MAHRLAEVETEKNSGTHAEVEAQVLVDTIYDRLSFIEVDTLDEKRHNVIAKVQAWYKGY